MSRNVKRIARPNFLKFFFDYVELLNYKNLLLSLVSYKRGV